MKETNKEKTPEEVKSEVAQEEYNKVAKEVEEVLTKNKFGFQPFLVFNELGILPRIRLVKIEDEKKDPTTTKGL